MNNYSFYVLDTETTGLKSAKHSPIEISLIRLPDGLQKTWRLKAIDADNIDDGALRVNGHKREDITWITKVGRDTYLEPSKVLVDIENFVMEDGVSADRRFLIGQNVSFDKDMLEKLWDKCEASDSFPFGRRTLDTMIIELFIDFCKGEFADNYSLAAITKKHGIKNSKAHSAEADTLATKEVFLKQVELQKKLMNAT